MTTTESFESTGVNEDHGETIEEQFQQAEDVGRAAAEGGELPKRERRRKVDDVRECVNLMSSEADPDALFTLMMEEDPEEMSTFLTAQMSAKAGLKHFGEDGAQAIMKELEQLLRRKVMKGRDANSLTKEQKKAALQHLMFLKEKRCGKTKGRGCADGRKQRLCKTKEETSSPAVSIEALFLSCIMDAKEGRCVVTCDIPGAFMQADMDELIHLKLEGDIALLLIRFDPTCQQCLTYEGKKPVVCAELSKALCGTLQAALLFWQNLSGFLASQGFEANPYDACVMNKMIDGEQCAVVWHVDDLKMSHEKEAVVESLVDALQEKCGKEAPLTVTRGKVHNYLGVKIDFSNVGTVEVSMLEHIEQTIAECPEGLLKGAASTPAAGHLFTVNPNAKKLSEEEATTFHHLVAKLLCLCKRSRPDMQTAISFLTTRVKSPDVDDCKKLGRCLKHLKRTKKIPLRLSASRTDRIMWWIDASFAVHHDCRSHTGATMSLGSGCPVSVSTKQKLNTRSSTEAELVGVNDGLTIVLWVRNFVIGQGCEVTDNVIHQDNQSAMLLEKNGRKSSGKKTRHIEIRCHFVADDIRRGTTKVAHCPTEEMVADFFTKPLQGSLFRKFFKMIMGCALQDYLDIDDEEESLDHEPRVAEEEAQECVESTVPTESCLPPQPSYKDVVTGVSGKLDGNNHP